MGPEGVVVPLDDGSLREAVAAVAAAGVEAVAVCLLFAFLHPEHERAVGDALRVRVAGCARFALVRAAARVPGVRALLDHRGERVPGARAVGVPGEDRAAAAGHAVLGRSGRCGHGGRPAGFVRPFRAGGRGRRGGVRRGRRRLRGRADLRHGRDEHRRRGRPRGRGAGHGRVGGRGSPDPVPDGRRAHDRRRRRLDRVARRRRRAAGRATFCGSASRPGLLRPGRRGGDGHRREPRPRLPGRRGGPRRRGHARPGPGRSEPWRDYLWTSRYTNVPTPVSETGCRTPRARTRPEGPPRPPPESFGSSRPRWRGRSAWSASSAGSIRAGLRWSPSAAPGPCMPARWPRSSGMERVLVPLASGMLSALGLAAADLRRDYVGGSFVEMEARAARDLPGAATLRLVDARYRGQSHELTVGAEELGVESGRRARAALRVPARRRARDRHATAGRDPPASASFLTEPGAVGIALAAVARISTAGGSTFPSTGPARPSRARRSSSCPVRRVSSGAGWSGEPDDAGTLVLERAWTR